jgi:hypothetical protein
MTKKQLKLTKKPVFLPLHYRFAHNKLMRHLLFQPPPVKMCSLVSTVAFSHITTLKQHFKTTLKTTATHSILHQQQQQRHTIKSISICQIQSRHTHTPSIPVTGAVVLVLHLVKTTSNKQQTTNNKQQQTNNTTTQHSKQQTTNSKQHNKQQTTSKQANNTTRHNKQHTTNNKQKTTNKQTNKQTTNKQQTTILTQRRIQ